MKQIQTLLAAALLICSTAQSAQHVQSKGTISPAAVIGLGAAAYAVYSGVKFLMRAPAKDRVEFLFHMENINHIEKHIEKYPWLLTCTFGNGKYSVPHHGGSLLHVAVAYGRADVVALLVERYHVSLEVRDKQGKTAEERAVGRSPEVVAVFEEIKKIREEEPGILNEQLQ